MVKKEGHCISSYLYKKNISLKDVQLPKGVQCDRRVDKVKNSKKVLYTCMVKGSSRGTKEMKLNTLKGVI